MYQEVNGTLGYDPCIPAPFFDNKIITITFENVTILMIGIHINYVLIIYKL